MYVEDSSTVAMQRQDKEAERVIDRIIADSGRPVVMFALELCEFCWAVRALFSAFGVSCRRIDLDSIPWKAGNRGTRLRRVLCERFGARGVPQVFVGATHVGGCEELFAAREDGRLLTLLAKHGIIHRQPADFELQPLLQRWMQSKQ